MESRAIAESALRQLSDRIGVPYTTENVFCQGAWFLASITRNRVAISQWDEGSKTGGRSIRLPLGSYGDNLTHEQVYDRCWFADRCFTAHTEAVTHYKATHGDD